ncbi:hypothetical protein [Clostridium beijerinckii]|uniref:hypothetical protein n=1 Tax=Clostridium beijerinckii TaxID=1520 RepID=UPI00098C69ED|nr:hypothetical protein [Clostridium beijerinckii]NRT77664.1 hypothetical protein [Clostridium beijerinckii]OOM50434.1 hypothetical protein CBEIJ_04040 [Clostridium beijerinckii]
MKYVHPKHYNGLKFDTPHNQDIVKARVEKYCLKCDLFMGKEHDFSECQTFDKRKNGEIVEKKNCPFDNMAVSLIQPEIRCKTEEE